LVLSRWLRADASNKYCRMRDLSSETTVEQFFLIRLLRDLGFEDRDIRPKERLDEMIISAGGRRRENYRPDYVCFVRDKPKLVVEAKATKENIDDFIYQPAGYALALNRRFDDENPVLYFLISNGGLTRLFQWDRDRPLNTLEFTDFVNGNERFDNLFEMVSYESLRGVSGRDALSITDFLTKPSIDEVKRLFARCHNLIWRKEKIYPTDAFYEFSKLIFLKLNEDKRIREIVNREEGLTKDDFRFSVEWIRREEETTPNPINAIMFAQLMRELNRQVEQKRRKPIFAPDEEINLKPSTILEVVRLLQNIDLFTIDEDLNGRMFEVFLTAVIRGKELGAFFTPRALVKFMTNIANLRVYRERGELVIDKILDGCCGSGGFLIDAMVDMINKVKDNRSLTSEQDEIIEEILSNNLFGVDANPKITRIARINMYVHGDGGSRIYCADTLDKTVTIERGEVREFARDLEELRGLLLDRETPLKFDVVLTNPPFAMNYSRREDFERQILEQYGSTNPDENISYKTGTTDLKASVKSNVLFLARYAELLKSGGKLIIIVDNSLLNSYSDRDYRKWLKRNFIIKAVISLPQHTFVNAGAGGATSILYLEKRRNPDQTQPPIFARKVENVGHSKSGKEIEENDLPDVQMEFELFEKTGRLYLKGETLIPDFEDDRLFLIDPDAIDERLDVDFHMPSYHRLMDRLDEMAEKGIINLTTIQDYDLLDKIKPVDHKNDIYKYVEITNVDKERGTILLEECVENTLDNLPNRARQIIHENFVLFSKPFRSLKKVAIVPKELDGHLASTGFVGIKCKDYDEACLLWSILRSDLVQKQFFHISSGYTQREMSNEYIEKYLKIPIPIQNRDEITKRVKHQIELAREARVRELEALEQLNTIYTIEYLSVSE